MSCLTLIVEHRHHPLVSLRLAWIASKVKSETPPPAPVEPAPSMPSVNSGLPKVSGDSVVVVVTDKPARRRKPTRKKTRKTTTVPTTVSANADDDDDDDDDDDKNEKPKTSKGKDASKAAIKRVVRALVNRF